MRPGDAPFPTGCPCALSFGGSKCVGETRDFPLAPGWALRAALVQSVRCSPDQPTPGFPAELGC